MKKIIMVLVIFISSIIFYDSYVNLSRQQYNDVINLSYKFAQENDMEVVPIDLQLSEDKQERTEQFNQVYSFLQEHSYPCFVGIVSKNIKTEYVYLPKQNKLPIYTEENKAIDFNKIAIIICLLLIRIKVGMQRLILLIKIIIVNTIMCIE